MIFVYIINAHVLISTIERHGWATTFYSRAPTWNVKVMVWFNIYNLSFYVDVTTYLCPNPDVNTVNICPDEIRKFVQLNIQGYT